MTGLLIGGFFIIFALLIIAIAVLYSRLMESKDQQIAQLQAALEKIQAELDVLKGRRRQTGPTMAAAEDAMANIASVIVNRGIEDVRLNAALNYLQQLRQGPYAYKQKPSGKREDFE